MLFAIGFFLSISVIPVILAVLRKLTWERPKIYNKSVPTVV